MQEPRRSELDRIWNHSKEEEHEEEKLCVELGLRAADVQLPTVAHSEKYGDSI